MLFKDMAIWGFQVTTSHQRCWGCHSKLTNWPPKKKIATKISRLMVSNLFLPYMRKWSHLTHYFFKWVETSNKILDLKGVFPISQPLIFVSKKKTLAGEEMVIPNGGALNRNMVPLTPSGLMSLGPFVWWFFSFFFGWKNWQQQKTNMFYLPKKSFFGGQVLHRFLLVGNVFCCGFLPLFFRTKKGVVLIGGPSVEDFCNKKNIEVHKKRCWDVGCDTLCPLCCSSFPLVI